jgi:hypothetical protein
VIPAFAACFGQVVAHRRLHAGRKHDLHVPVLDPASQASDERLPISFVRLCRHGEENRQRLGEVWRKGADPAATSAR